MKNHLLYKASRPSNPLTTAAGSESFLNWGDGGYMVWLFAATAPGEVAARRKGWREGKRQELAPIAIVNPLLAHGDILGLEGHKKRSEEIEIETMKKVRKMVCEYLENKLCVTNSINIL